MSAVVERTVQDGVALLTLNRPERLNAWTPAMGRAYFDSLEECAALEEVRAIVVTGEGRGFCAGADMENLQSLGENGAEAGAGERDPRPQSFPLSIPKPIIAAVNGACAGIGLVLALMCDIRFAAESAKLTTAFARRGLVAEYGIAWISRVSSVRRGRSTFFSPGGWCSARRPRRWGSSTARSRPSACSRRRSPTPVTSR